MENNNKQPSLSIIIPVYNEKESLPLLFEELFNVGKILEITYEIICVDDGSCDGSLETLSLLQKKRDNVSVVVFKKNFGQTAALTAGIDHAKGDVIVTLDADLQNDPSDIPKLLKKIDEGYDVASGWRKIRHDPLFSRKIPSWCANKLISLVTGVKLHDYGCTLKAYRRESLGGIELYGEMHRFLPALTAWNGARVGEIEVNHRPRRFGRSKYGMGRVTRVLLDLVTVKFLLSFRTRPIQFFGRIGLLAVVVGFLLFATVVIMKIWYGSDITGNPLFLLSILSILIGTQFIVLGLLGEMLTRIYYSGTDRKTYVIKKY